MERERGFKIIAIIALVVAIAGLTIGYAAYTETLKIDGAANVDPSSWSIYFKTDGDFKGITTGNATVNKEPTLESTTISGFDVTLKAPGDSVTYTFDVKNAGNLSAKLKTFVEGTLSCTPATGSTISSEDANNLCKELKYKLTYSDGRALSPNVDILPVAKNGESGVQSFKLKLEWPNESIVQVDDEIKISIGTTTLIYTQN